MPPVKGRKKETRSHVEIIKSKEEERKGGRPMSQKRRIVGIVHEMSDPEDEEQTVKLPLLLAEIQDTRPVEDNKPTYRCSTLSRVFLKRNSNFDKILKDFCVARNLKDPRNDSAGLLIRRLFSAPFYRCKEIYRDFEADSLTTIAVMRELLKFPNVNNYEDLRNFELFQRESGLKRCLVVMDESVDLVARDGNAFVRAAADGRIKEATPQRHNDFILRSYYYRENLLIHRYKNSLTYDELCSFSNFEEEVVLQMERRNEPMEGFDECRDFLFEKFCTQRHLLKYFKVYKQNPRYVLISGHITTSQHELIIQSCENFFKMTNAVKILQEPAGLHHTKQSLFEHYLARSEEDRQHYPFNDLIFYEVKNKKSEKLASTKKRQPTAKRQHVTFRDEIPSTLPKSTLAASKKPDVSCMMIVPPRTDEYLAAIIKKLQDDEKFLDNMRTYFINHYNPEQVDLPSMWRSNKYFIVLNLVEEMLSSRSDESLKTLQAMCRGIDDEEAMAEEMAIYFQTYKEIPEPLIYEDVYSEDEDEEMSEAATKTPNKVVIQSVEVLVSPAPAADDVNSSDAVVSDANMPSPSHSDHTDLSDQSQSSNGSTVIEVKQEKMTPRISSINDSDVVFMGTMPDLIIDLDDSSSGEAAAATIETQESQENELMKLIAAGSQNLSPPPPSPAFSPIGKATNQAANDTFQRLEPRALRYAPKRRPGPKSKQPVAKVAKTRAQSNVAGEIEYIDEDEDDDEENQQNVTPPGNGNENITSPPPPSVDVVGNLNLDDFSFLLSSQLMDKAQAAPQNISNSRVLSETCPFTHATPFLATSTPSAPVTRTRSITKDHQATKTSFHAHIKSVEFIKDLKFEVFINIPQYHLFNLLISDDANIQKLFNVADDCFWSLKNLMNALGSYEYQKSPCTRGRGKLKARPDTIRATVDNFFESHHEFNIRHFQYDGESIQFQDAPPEYDRSNVDLTSAIGVDALERMVKYKPKKRN